MSERILAVDDDESMVEIYEAAMRAAGYEVATASGGAEAVERVKAEPFDLVITDLQMPEVGGEEVVRRVKALRPKTELIVITGTPTLQSAISTLKDGAYDYVFKPVVVEHLRSVVRRCLDHRRLREELAGERALRQELAAAYEELQKVEKLKEGILARVGHELRTPLAELSMALTILREGQAGKLDAAGMAKTLDTARQSSARLDRTLADLLSFTELGAEPPRAGFESVDLAKLCAEILERMRPLWEPRGLKVSCAFPAGFPPARGSREQLTKVFEHVIHNAILFNKPEGALRVEGGKAGAQLRVAVTDEGEGIPDSELHHIFDSFYQVANYLTRKVEGLGLGLAISRRIAEAHGGSLSVSSKLGQGSTFTVSLPAA